MANCPLQKRVQRLRRRTRSRMSAQIARHQFNVARLLARYPYNEDSLIARHFVAR